MSAEPPKEDNAKLLEYAKKLKLKIKKLEGSNEEFIKNEEILRQRVTELEIELQETKAARSLGVVTNGNLDWAAERDFLEKQLDDKSREIFSIKKQTKEQADAHEKSLNEKDAEISDLKEKLKLSLPESGRQQAAEDLASALKSKDDELHSLKQKLTKFMGIAKSKVKEAEMKDQEIERLKISLEAAVSPATSILSQDQESLLRGPSGCAVEFPISKKNDDDLFLLVHRIICTDMKNVEVSGTISGMFSGAFGSALGSALGSENDPFVTLSFLKWAIRTPTVQEGGSNTEWNNLQARIILSKSDLTEPILVKVFDENSIRANVLIGQAAFNIRDLINRKNELCEFSLELEDNSGEKTGMISLTVALYSLTGPSSDTSPELDKSTEYLQCEVEYKDEISRLQETLSQRERSLEMAALTMSETMKATEEKDVGINSMLRRIEDLALELDEKDLSLRKLQNQMSLFDELKQKNISFEIMVSEKDTIIDALTNEGQQLAKKQNDMEKMTRKLKEMIKKKDSEIEVFKSAQTVTNQSSSQSEIMESAKVAKAEAENFILQAEIKQLKEEMDSTILAKDIEVTDLNRKLVEVTSALGHTQHDNDVEHKKLQEHVILLKEDVLKLKNELSDFQLKLKISSEEKEALENELTSLQDSLRATTQHDEIITAHSSSIDQLLGAEAPTKDSFLSSEILSKRLASVEAQLVESEELRESESREIQELEEVVESLEIERSNLQDLVSTLRTEVKILKESSHLKNLRAPVDSETIETKMKLQQVIDFLVAEKSANELLVEQLQKVNSEMTTSLAEAAYYKSKISICEQQGLDSNFLYETSKNSANDQILGLESALKSRALEVQALEDEVSIKCSTIDTLNQSKSKLESDCENMRLKITDISTLLDSLPSRESYASLESSLLVKQKEIDRLQNDLLLSISSQNSMVPKGDFNKLEEIIVSQKAQIQALNIEIDEMKSVEIHERVNKSSIDQRLEDQRCVIERLENEKELIQAEILALETKFTQLYADKDKLILDKDNLISEKDTLVIDIQKSSDTLSLKLEDALRDAAEARQEREKLRRKLLDLEFTIEELQQKSGENFLSLSHTADLEEELRILRARSTDMDEINVHLQQQCVLLETSINDMKNLIDSANLQLESANSKILLLESESKSNEVEKSISQGLKEQVIDLSRKLTIMEKKHEEDSEASSEKIRRLKILLSKTKQSVQEKEEELADAKKLSSTSLGRPSNVNVKCRILLAGETQKDKEGWCFIADENGKNRWILESILQQYSSEGTLVVNSNDEYMNVTLERRIAELKFAYENEIETLRTEIDENEKKFIAYKERAQLALKRMNKDEHDVKRKAQVDEEFHVKQYIQQISDLESRLDDISLELSSCRQDLSVEVFKLQECEKKCKELESINKDRDEKIRHMDEEMATLSKTFEIERSTFTSDIQLIYQRHREEVEKLKSEHQHILSSKIVSPAVLSNEKHAKDGQSIDFLPMTVKTSSATKPNSSFDSVDSDFGCKPLKTPDTRIREKLISGTPALKTTNRSILLSHTEGDMTQTLAYLRDENASLSADYNDLKQEIALVLEQEKILKDTIRELECALQREKEFNASDRKINTEYLVNILKRFLTTDCAEEKGRLAPVICSILRFSPEVSLIVSKKWAVYRRGIVGWLLPAAPLVDVENSDNAATYDPTGDAIGAYGSY